MNQFLVEGVNSIDEICKVLERFAHTKILLVTGKTSYHACGAKEKLDALLSNKEVVLFSDFTPNPKDKDVVKGINIFNQEGCDLIIAVGGGSSLDIAKLIKFYVNAESLFGSTLTKPQQTIDRLPLIAIPTTAGSGSEATHFAVVYIEGVKHSIADQSILPDAVILEPTFLINTPKHITKCSGIDAFCQAIESIWNVHSTNESSRMATKALHLMIANLPQHIDHPSIESATPLQKGAYLAGQAINITKTTAPHAMSYALTSKYGICHGQAVAVYLPTVLLFNADINQANVADGINIAATQATMNMLFDAFHTTNAKDCAYSVSEFVKSLGLKTSLSELGVNSEDRDELLSTVNLERLANNPRKLDHDDLVRIFDQTL